MMSYIRERADHIRIILVDDALLHLGVPAGTWLLVDPVITPRPDQPVLVALGPLDLHVRPRPTAEPTVGVVVGYLAGWEVE